MSRQIGLNLDPIINVGGVGFTMKRGTIDFFELAYNEGIANAIISDIGYSYDSTKVYIIYGCIITTAGGNTTVSSGAIFFNGEIFLCAGNTFANPVGGNTIVANLLSVSWQPTDAVGNHYADPQEFDGAPNSNIHIIRTCTFASGASGSGTISSSTASNYFNILSIYGSYDESGIDLNSGTIVFTKGKTIKTSSSTVSSSAITLTFDFSKANIGDEMYFFSNVASAIVAIGFENVITLGLNQISGITVGDVSTASNVYIKVKLVGFHHSSGTANVPVILVDINYYV